MGISKLRMPEEEFWRTTPRKFNALMTAYGETVNPNSKKSTSRVNTDGFIDNIPGW